MKNMKRSALIALVFAVQAIAPTGGVAFAFNASAQAVVGQPHMLANILNEVTNSSLFWPHDIVRDQSVPQTRIYVADSFNSRVLGIECDGIDCQLPSLNTADLSSSPPSEMRHDTSAAVRVFGQPDYSSYDQNGGLLGSVSGAGMSYPRGVAVDAAGTLYVADTANNRVLVFWSAWDDPVPDVVLGQTSMTTNAPGSGWNQLRAPEGVFFDAATGALWVADTGNNRVLKFTTIANGASAALAIGGGGGASSRTMSGPRGVQIDWAGGLYVADTGFSRVLRFAPPLSSGMAASIVFGHGGNMSNGSANLGGVGAGSLANPEKLSVDPSGRLWVADTGNNRVFEYDNPLGSQIPTRVFGQANRSQVPSYTTNTNDAPDGFPNAAGLAGPRGMAFDSHGTLWLCDTVNSRILGFYVPLSTQFSAAITADLSLGKPDFVGSYANLPSARSMNNPVGVAVDRSTSPNRLWVVDIGNNRALGYGSTLLGNNDPADVVLGQYHFTDGSTNAGINGPLQNADSTVASVVSLFYPIGVAVDSLGGVYVGDNSNARVLRFADPFGTDKIADNVFGQTNFSSRNPFYPWGSAGSLAGVAGVSIGPGDALWVADTMDNRVVRFNNAPYAPATGSLASLVLGQSGFINSSSFPPYASGCSANRMNAPRGVYAAPSQRVYVADSANNRVLVFQPPFSNGMSASAVFGQSSFTSCSANRGGGAGAATLNYPEGVFEDATGRVFIADSYNNRVLVYDAPFSGGDLTADHVIGQPNFTSTAVFAPTPETLIQPVSVAMDDSGNLFVADREDSRVTRYAIDAPPRVVLDPIADPLMIGAFNALTGSGFSPGSAVIVFVATSAGSVKYGPYSVLSRTAGSLVWFLPVIPAGSGFATIQVVNTDQGNILSNSQSQLLYGLVSRGLPTIMALNSTPLNPFDPAVPLATVETVVPQDSVLTIDGTGFSNPEVVVYSTDPTPVVLEPLPGGFSEQIQVQIPAGLPTGPGTFVVVNRPSLSESAAVSAPIGERIALSSVSQVGKTVTMTGEGFCTQTYINLFNRQGSAVVNLGGLTGNGQSIIPLTLVSSHMMTFQVPASARSGSSYLQAVNPPYIEFTSTRNSPHGSFNLIQP